MRMTASRKLTLKKETLADLTSDELRGVVGGVFPSGTTCPVKACMNSDYNCAPTFQESCIGTCRCTPALPQ
jgi:hypothetical protein